MASVKDVKSAFVEDDAVIVPAPAGGSMGPPPPKRPKADGNGADEKGKGKEWWEVDDEEEYVPLRKRRDQAVTASASRLGLHEGRVGIAGRRPMPRPGRESRSKFYFPTT